jgi:glycosyltransferase involved in cell wall biosynthesis
LYRRAWALLFPSIWEEPLPYVVMEAMLTQTIPIASKVGGVLELIISDRLREFMFKPESSEELYEKIMNLLSLCNDSQQNIFHFSSYFDANTKYLVYKLKSSNETLEKNILNI